jgi:hypothetical protein
MSPKVLSWIFHILFVIAVILFIVYAALAPNDGIEKGTKIGVIAAASVFLILSVGAIVWYYIVKNKAKKGMGYNPEQGYSSMSRMNPTNYSYSNSTTTMY